MKNIFNEDDAKGILNRIQNLSDITQGHWGKMTVSQMLAHCCVTYEFVYDNVHPVQGAFKKFLLKRFVKPFVVSEKPYKRNSRTSSFIRLSFK